MARNLSKPSERQILKALAEGKLKNLAGEGKPLPEHPEAAFVDAAEAAGYRIMAEAGALPEEFEIKRALAEAKDAYRGARGTPEEKHTMSRISDLTLRLEIAREARRKFMKG